MSDIRLAIRALRRSPGFAAVALITLALGIAANTTAFSIVEALVLRPLAVEDPERIVSIESNRNVSVSFPDYLDAQRGVTTFSGLAAYRITAMALDQGGGAQHVWGYLRPAITSSCSG